ncbi:MAG: hypothetical protein JXA44_11095 [Methanospirillaceae archaeon]|nr:hypothetical protein [Methanospirillaceae archaeon]
MTAGSSRMCLVWPVRILTEEIHPHPGIIPLRISNYRNSDPALVQRIDKIPVRFHIFG